MSQPKDKQEYNPVLVREMRELVRNRIAITGIGLFLCLMVLVCFWKIVETGDGWTESSGLIFFWAISQTVFFGSSVFVIGYTSIRFAFERFTEDAMLYTSLDAGKIMHGKLQAGMVITAILFSMALPFLMLAYLLRGVDVLQAIILYVFMFFFVQQMNTCCIGICALLKSPGQGIGVFLLFSPVLIVFFGPVIICFFEGTIYDQGALFFWLFISLIPCWLFLWMGKRMFGGDSDVLMFLFRIITSYSSASFLAIVLLVSLVEPESGIDFFAFWTVCMFLVVTLNSLIGTSEREIWGWKIRKKIPQSEKMRAFMYLFNAGSPNALLWSLNWIRIGMLTALFIFVRSSISYYVGEYENMKNFDLIRYATISLFLSALALAILTSCVTVVLLRNRLKKFIPKDATWLLALIPLFIVFYIGYVISESFGRMYTVNSGFVFWLSIFLFVFTFVWNTISFRLARPWFKECYERFTPLACEERRRPRTFKIEPPQPKQQSYSNIPKEPEV